MNFSLVLIFVFAFVQAVVGGPLAYATCQAACAAGCALTAVFFVPCYAAGQVACVAALLAPTP